MQRIFFVLLLLFYSLHADEEAIQGRLSADQQPQAVVGGCVNVVSGSFFFSENDLPAVGLGSLQLVRCYDSGNSEKGFFGKGMSHTFPINLKAKEKHPGSSKYSVDASLSLGESSAIPYQGKLSAKKSGLCSMPSDFRKKSGYTGSINPLNRMEPHLGKIRISSEKKGKWTVLLSNGTQRHFEHKHDYEHRLMLEELLSGQSFHYKYYSAKSLRILLKDAENTVLSSLFMWDGSTKFATIDGKKKCNYHFDSRDRLKKVAGDHILTQDYEYNTSGKLIKLWRGGNKYLKIKYFTSDKYHRGKVKNIQRCIENGYEKLYTFSYKKDKTIVTCPLKNTQTYTYRNHRIVQFDDINAFRSWKYRYTTLADIKSIGLYDIKEGSVCRHYVDYAYDKNGNPLNKRVYGQITGDQSDVVSFTKLKPDEEQLFQEALFEYSDDGFSHLVKEIKPNGTEIHYAYYSGTSLVRSKLTISEGVCRLREFYTYNAAGFKTEVIEDDGSAADEDDLSDVTYRMMTVNIYDNLLAYSTSKYYQDLDANKWILVSRKENIYDEDGHPVEQKVYDANGLFAYSTFKEYDAHGNILSEMNPLGELTLYKYDHLDRRIYEEQFGTGKAIHYQYNRWNELVKETEEHESGEVLTTVHTYDLAGNRITTTDWYGNKTLFVHDRCSRLISTIDSEGNFEARTYDLFNHPVCLTDKNGNKTRKTYNIFGRELTAEHPDGTFTSKIYTLDGNLHIKREADGSYIEYTYDYMDRVVKEETFSPEGESLAVATREYKGISLLCEVDPKGVKTEYTYDGCARKSSMRRGQYSEEYAYDALGRLYWTKIGDRIQVKEFDHLNRVIEERVESRSGEVLRKSTYAYDRFGNVQRSREYTTPTDYSESQTFYNSHNLIEYSIDPEGNATTYIYDFSNQFTKIRIDPLGQEKWEIFDQHNQCIRTEIRAFGEIYSCRHYAYDPAGNCIRQVHDIYTDAEKTGEYVIEWDYDEMGQVVREVEQGTKITETYYSLGRKACEIKPGGVSLCYEYDHFGRLSAMFSSDGTIDYQYSYDPGGNLTLSRDLIHQTVMERDYDENNNLIRERLPNGHESRFGYDNQGRLSKIVLPDLSEISYDYNPADMIAVRRGDKEHLYTYDLAGNVTSETSFHGEEVQYIRDANQRITSIQSDSFQQQLAFDPVGNIIRDNEEEYTYDLLYQLTSDQYSQYKYDSLNNRLEKNGTAYSHNSLQQVTSDGNVDYAYDGDGNRLLKGAVHYKYDALNRLIETDGIHYQYDSFGRLISRNGESYIYFKNHELGNASCLRLIGLGTIGIETSEGLFSTLCDYRGSVRVVSDSDLAIRAKYRYSAFGESTAEGDFHSPWQFYSQRVDIDTGLLHFFKRVYDPVIGSWLTPDPSGFSDGPNLYAYVHNNPLRFCDPYGLSAREFFRGFAGTAAQIGVMCVVRWAVIGALTTACAPAGIAVSAMLTTYSVGMTAYSAGKFMYDNYDTLGEIGDKARAGEIGELVAWGCDAIYNLPHEQLGQFACDAASMMMPVPKMKGSKNAQTGGKGGTPTPKPKVESGGSNVPAPTQTKTQLPTKLDLDALSRAGQAYDRNGLTLAGRSLDKHGNRIGSPFELATGNSASKNIQGQFVLDDILTDPFGKIKFNSSGSVQIYSSDGRGAYFNVDGTFRGFLDK